MKSVEELAIEQGVGPCNDPATFFGTWPGEVDDGFEEFIEQHRHGLPPWRWRNRKPMFNHGEHGEPQGNLHHRNFAGWKPAPQSTEDTENTEKIMLDEKQQTFLEHITNLSKEIAPQYGVDWRLMAATAILETGWGQSELAREAHNLFGIMATKSTQEEDVYILRAVRWDKPKRFRFFRNEEDSCHAYGRLMSRSSHYAPARDVALEAFVTTMAPVYCPDPGYGADILRLIKSLV